MINYYYSIEYKRKTNNFHFRSPHSVTFLWACVIATKAAPLAKKLLIVPGAIPR